MRMFFLTILFLPFLFMNANAQDSDVVFTNELGGDQSQEEITILVNEKTIGTLKLKRPLLLKGSLTFPVLKDGMAPYQLTGTAQIYDTAYTLFGAGVLISQDWLKTAFDEKVPLSNIFEAYINIITQAKNEVAKVEGVNNEDMAQLTEMIITRPLTLGTPQEISLAEKRLKINLPDSLKSLLLKVGTFHVGENSFQRAHFFSASEIVSLAQWISDTDESGVNNLEAIKKRHPLSTQDLIIGITNGEEPIILRTGITNTTCKAPEVPISLPGDDIDLLRMEHTTPLANVAGNYQLVIGASASCLDLDKLYRKLLIDSLSNMYPEFITVLSPNTSYGAWRESTDTEENKILIRFNKLY